MRTVLEVITFFTPIDDRIEIEAREGSIEDMIATAMQNSGENFQVSNSENAYYSIYSYSIVGIEVVIEIKKDEYMEDYYAPHMLLRVQLQDSFFEKENIEDFLNTIVRFFSGMYMEDYFISYDTQYTIIAMNSGKKYSVENIKNVDTSSVFSEKNKILLDSLLYLHYTLEKSIEQISTTHASISSIPRVDNRLQDALTSAGIRKNEVQESLIKNLQVLHSQIEIIFTYFL